MIVNLYSNVGLYRGFKIWDWNSASVKQSCEIKFFYSIESLTLTKMDRLIITQRVKMIKTYYKIGWWSVDGNFSNKIFFSDEIDFTIGGYVNKQNCRIWGSENPQVIEERPLHTEKATCWCVLWSEDTFCLKVVENCLKKINAWNTSCGGLLNDVKFHTQCQRLKFTIKNKYHEKHIYMCFI